MQGHKSAVKRGKTGIIRSYEGIAQRSAAQQAGGDRDPGAGGAERAKALCVIS
nr:MAG TPA: hypothetical protein [Bacteriophage sp.]